MRSFNDLSLTKKLYGGFGIVVAVVAVLGVVVTLSMGSMNGRSSSVTSTVIPATRAIDDMTNAANTLVRHQREHLGTAVADRPGIADEIAKDEAEFRTALTGLGALAASPVDRENVAGVKTLFDKYLADSSSFLTLSNANKTAKAAGLLEATDPAFTAVEDALAKLGTAEKAKATQAAAAVSSSYTSARLIVFVLFGIALLLASGIAYLLARRIGVGVGQVLRAAEAISTGELDQTVDATSKDEIGQMAGAFTRMIDYLKTLAGAAERIAQGDLSVHVQPVSERDTLGNAFRSMSDSLTTMVGQVRSTSQTLSASSKQMASTSEEVGRAVGEIAQAVSDVATGAEHQVRLVEETRASARETADQANEARTVAQEGGNAVAQASLAMEAMRESTASVTEAMRGLAGKSEQIGGIVETITGIASQTNLLALNAAIEAARAGEQGRGFAVVAEEVRKLAEESQSAATRISELIGEIQTETHRTVEVVEEGRRRTEQGVAVVELAREAFQRIGDQVDEVASRINAIVESTTEVAAVAEESSASTEEVSASTQETSASAEQIAASAQELATTADSLQRLVTQFTLAG